jgi:hypothetical protein
MGFVARYRVSNGVEFYENLTKASEGGDKRVHKLVLKNDQGQDV